MVPMRDPSFVFESGREKQLLASLFFYFATFDILPPLSGIFYSVFLEPFETADFTPNTFLYHVFVVLIPTCTTFFLVYLTNFLVAFIFV